MLANEFSTNAIKYKSLGDDFLKKLVSRPGIRRKGPVGFFTIRRWRADMKRTQIDELKRMKRDHCDRLAGLAATDIVTLLNAVAPFRDAIVAPIPCGNGGTANCLSKRIAQKVAIAGHHHFQYLWEDRITFSGSHPRRNIYLEPLRWRNYPSRPVIVVDDVATTGTKMSQALRAVRTLGCPVIGVAWISGTTEPSRVHSNKTATAIRPDIAYRARSEGAVSWSLHEDQDEFDVPADYENGLPCFAPADQPFIGGP